MRRNSPAPRISCEPMLEYVFPLLKVLGTLAKYSYRGVGRKVSIHFSEGHEARLEVIEDIARCC